MSAPPFMPVGASVVAMPQSPAVLLLITGTLIGLNFPLGKIAGDAGVSPLIWALLISLGASSMLLPLLLATRSLNLPSPRNSALHGNFRAGVVRYA